MADDLIPKLRYLVQLVAKEFGDSPVVDKTLREPAHAATLSTRKRISDAQALQSLLNLRDTFDAKLVRRDFVAVSFHFLALVATTLELIGREKGRVCPFDLDVVRVQTFAPSFEDFVQVIREAVPVSEDLDRRAV